MSNKYKEYYKIIEENQSYFKSVIEKMNAETDLKNKLNIAFHALYFATFSGTGYYYSKDLEAFFISFAKMIDANNYNVEYEKNSFLHVMTEAYLTGGHTRVVERWISQSEQQQKHSVVILNQRCPYPELLENNVKSRNGEFLLLNTGNMLDKAMNLRKLGLDYEYIVLHTHMQDPIATMAFGSEKFTRPVIFFNHADHMFWIGKSIIDIVADLKTINSISKSRRNLENTFNLGIPLEDRTLKLKDKDEARSLLGIPKDKKIILSIGNPNKFDAICGDSIVPILKKIFTEQDDIICYMMGPSLENAYWKNIYEETNKKMIPMGMVAYDKEYFDCIAAADLIIDSYPIGGGTALMDCVIAGKTVLSIRGVLGQFDYIEKSQSICDNEQDFIEKVIKVLNNEQYAKELSTELRKLLDEDCSEKNWAKKLKELIEKTPKVHTVKDLTKEVEPISIDDHDVLIDISYKNLSPKKILV